MMRGRLLSIPSHPFQVRFTTQICCGLLPVRIEVPKPSHQDSSRLESFLDISPIATGAGRRSKVLDEASTTQVFLTLNLNSTLVDLYRNTMITMLFAESVRRCASQGSLLLFNGYPQDSKILLARLSPQRTNQSSFTRLCREMKPRPTWELDLSNGKKGNSCN